MVSLANMIVADVSELGLDCIGVPFPAFIEQALSARAQPVASVDVGLDIEPA